jgi:transposase
VIGLTRAVRVFAYGAPVDLRKGFNGLSALVEQEMKHKASCHEQQGEGER